jgi:hypothetical protein
MVTLRKLAAALAALGLLLATPAAAQHADTFGKITITRLAVLSGAALNGASATVASASTTDIGAAAGNYVTVTGTTTITSLGTVQAGAARIVKFGGVLTITYNATSLILPTGATITTAAGDTALFVSEGSGNWRCVSYQRADGTPLAGGGGGGGGTPGGSSGQIQYNNAGSFGGFTASGDATVNTGTGAVTIANNAVTNAKAAQAGANTMKGNWTGSTANVADNAMPSCPDTGGNHLNYVNGTGITCGTSGGGGGGSTTIVAPQGRLTLVSGTPVMTSDQTAKSTIYYDCYIGNAVPYYNGSTDALDTISGCEVSLTMQTSGTGVTNNDGVFDIWWVHGGANRICVATNGSGGGWANDIGGGGKSNSNRAAAGYSTIHNTRGYWTNVTALDYCYNGTTNYGTVAVDQATYLGTIYTTAAGRTGMAFQPSPASGGTGNVLGLYNAYNRVAATAIVRDSSASWTYGSSSPRNFNASSSWSVTFVDGLAQSQAQSLLFAYVAGSGTGAYFTIGTSLDGSGSLPINGTQIGGGGGTPAQGATFTSSDFFLPVYGQHVVYAVEMAGSGTNSTIYTQPFFSAKYGTYLTVTLAM